MSTIPRARLHRRHGRSVVHGARLRQRRTGRGRRCADAQAVVRASVHRRSHDPAIELAEKLKEIAPVPISKVFFCNSGSEANDTQIKLVWYLNNARGRPKKKKIISRVQGLSRRHHRGGVADRAAGQSSRLRSSAAGLSARRLSASLSLRAAKARARRNSHAARRRARSADRQARAGYGRGLHRRAGDGRGRRDRAAENLFREDHGGVRQARCVRDQRRGDLRLRPARHACSAARSSASGRRRFRSPRRCRRPICRSPP